MNDKERPLFHGIDEFEREYAPEELPPDDPEGARARAEGDAGSVHGYDANNPPSPAPAATSGTSPSSVAAPPNIGHEDHGGAPGDPETEARYPMDDGRQTTDDR